MTRPLRSYSTYASVCPSSSASSLGLAPVLPYFSRISLVFFFTRESFFSLYCWYMVSAREGTACRRTGGGGVAVGAWAWVE
jgi:hypothetical protein